MNRCNFPNMVSQGGEWLCRALSVAITCVCNMCIVFVRAFVYVHECACVCIG